MKYWLELESWNPREHIMYVEWPDGSEEEYHEIWHEEQAHRIARELSKNAEFITNQQKLASLSKARSLTATGPDDTLYGFRGENAFQTPQKAFQAIRLLFLLCDNV